MDNCNFSFWALLLGILIGNAIYAYAKGIVIAAWDDLESHRSRKRIQKERKRKEVPGDMPPPRRRRKSER